MKIAAFDSGIGGLTALAPLFKNYTGLNVTYFGDLANLPYGSKSPERIQQLVKANVEWLLEQDNFDLLILACNTASAHALNISEILCQKKGISSVGVITPGCKQATLHAKERVVVLATAATVGSLAYETGLRKEGFQGEVIQVACPLFVPLVEEAFVSGAAVEEIAKFYLDSTLKKNDVVILGCTHYPLLLKSLKKFYPQVRWVDAGASLIEEKLVKSTEGESQLKMLFTDKNVKNDKIEFFLQSMELASIKHSMKCVNPIV